MTHRRSLRRRLYGAGAGIFLCLGAGLLFALAASLIGCICARGLPSLSWEFLTGRETLVSHGILPAVCNTLYVILVSLALALPLGVGAAVFLTEYAGDGPLARTAEFALETLAGVPSILYALVGLLAFCQFLGLQKSLLAGSMTMAVMSLPAVVRSTQESLRSVPKSYREGAMGLGGGKWHAVRTVVLPSAAGGIASGCVLAVGRVLGESAVLLYTAGLSTSMQDFSSFASLARASGATLSVALYAYAKEHADFASAFASATVLLALALPLNLAASLLKPRK